MRDSEQVISMYMEMHRLYIDTPKKDIVAEAEGLLGEGRLEDAYALLSQLDTKEQLLEKLFEKLKGKSVADTLNNILEGKCKNFYQGLKGMFSLCTHLCIELEKGNMEYKPLLEDALANIHKQMV